MEPVQCGHAPFGTALPALSAGQQVGPRLVDFPWPVLAVIRQKRGRLLQILRTFRGKRAFPLAVYDQLVQGVASGVGHTDRTAFPGSNMTVCWTFSRENSIGLVLIFRGPQA